MNILKRWAWSGLMSSYRIGHIDLIPSGWTAIPLSELFDFKNGLNKEKKFFGHGTPIINYMDVFSKSCINVEDIAGRVSVNPSELVAYGVQKGDVFFTRTSETVEEIGLASVILDEPQDTVFSGFVLRARSKSTHLDDKFKAYCFAASYFRKQVTSQASYTTRALTNGKSLSEAVLICPPLSEQTIIAKVLGDVDTLLITLNKNIAKTCDMKQAVMQQLLTGKTRLFGFSGKWGSKRLDEITLVQKGQLITSNSLLPGDVPVIAGGKQAAYHHAYANRFGKTITISASGASAGYVALHNTPIFASDCSTIGESNLYCIEYLYYSLSLNQEVIYGLQTGGAQPHINPKDIAHLLIQIPADVAEQRAIASILSDIDNQLVILQMRRNKTKKLKQAMMHELLTGKIRLINGGLSNV